MKPLCSSLLLILFLFSAITAFAQRTNIFQLQYNKSETDSLLRLLDTTTDLREKVLLYKTLCWKLRNTNAEDKAIYYADKGIELARKIKFKKAEADITRFKGIITWNFLHQNITYDLYNAALKLSKEIGDKEGEAYSYDRLGIAGFYNKRYKEAIQYFEKASAIFEEIKDNVGLSYVYSHFNWVYSTEKEYDKALETGRKALQLRTFLKNDEAVSNSLADLGLTYRDINADSALIYLTKSVELARARDLEIPLAEHSSLLADWYLQAKNYDKALQYANESYFLARKNNSKRQIAKTTKTISAIYEQQHNYSKALRFLHIYHNIRDSIFNEEINRRVVEQEMEYKYEKEKLTASEEERLTKVILTGVIILVVIVAVMIFIKYRIMQILKVEKLRRKISSDLHDDIGATLSSINIYSELAKNEKDNIDYIKTIQEHAQNTISNLDDLVWSINPNNDNLKVLIDRMRSFALPLLRDSKVKSEFITNMQDEETSISLEKRRSIYFAFKEMVANVLKHANSTFCSIEVQQKKSSLVIEVKDNGRGFNTNQTDNLRNGLRNLKTRASENHGNFSITSEPGKGTACTFSIILV